MKLYKTINPACGMGGLAGACLLLAFFVPSVAQAQGRPAHTRHVRDVVQTGQASLVGRSSATQRLNLNIGLPLRNESELDQLLQQMYDPQSPGYHQYLTVAQFTDQFGPSEEDYQAVVHFADANGLTVSGTARNRLVLDVSGSIENVERAFHIKIGLYQDPSSARTFYAPDREPTADLAFGLWHITGLDNFSTPQPASLIRNPAAKGTTTGSGPGGDFIGSDMRTAYYGGTTLTGSGQSIGLVEFAGYNINDVTAYFNKLKQPFSPGQVVGVSTDGSSLSCSGSCDDTEQVLDIEEAISMAPGLSQVRVYVSDTSDVSIFNKMATDNIAKSLSCSWGWDPSDPSSDDPIFKELAVQGQSLFVVSGDSGAYRKRSRYVYPADDIWITSVGGTDLTTNGAGGAWKSETAWSSSGGGISPDGITIPNYQTTKGVITSANKGSNTYRNSPDVAAEANTDNYICYDGTCAGGWGGTSFAAPRWAGYVTLVNQQAATNGHAPAGFINPNLYALGLGSSHGSIFHDITSGSNGTYSAVTGFDLVTGWGSPNGSGLIQALAP